ncbi:piggyBac transposable element-derived protein 3-like [Eriocheir sinensis]|uniref:piggyBac transposable element-derived protein 3-like n=1 Tax=Eriocheir sinensis TaxID=95602 RepID=UPI0021CA8036|nr:piggyBac transposable element-derived protein 3-like [Eriocheir sinensis]
MNIPSSGFYRKATDPRRWVAPPVAEDSDLEVEAESDVDDSDLDPDYVVEENMTPTTSGHVTRIRPEEMPLDDDAGEDDEDETVSGDTPPPTKKVKKAKDQPSRVWKKEDIGHTPLPEYNHPVPDFLLKPYEFFLQMLTMEILEDIVYQTNLYARQKDVSTAFSLDIQDLMVFLGIILYMGVVHIPSLDDYWAVNTRIPQVTDYMSAKRFKQLRSTIHFNNNDYAKASTDRFYKIRPLFTGITKQFLRVKETPHQSVDEVMVAYKGTMAGNLRQYIANKPDKFGYKLFCRASIDGFIHDVLMYQGQTSFSSHPVDLTEEEEEQLLSNRIVIVLAKTIKDPANSAIYADNYFTSIQLVEFLKDKLQCRYVGTARPNRIGNPPLMSRKEMEKKTTPRGKHDYVSCNGVLAMCRKDNKPVTILSSDAGVLPLSKAKRWDKESKKKVDIPCPAVIKEYNGKMGGIDKSDMLTHLYKSPMKARRYYLRLFGYILDLCTTNAWILYKRDSKALSEKPMPLKNFRLEISAFARGYKTRPARCLRDTPESFVRPKKGQKSHRPADNLRYDYSKFHCPVFVKQRMTCKHCSTHKEMHRSRWVCKVCQVALCHSETRNCFEEFHIRTPGFQLALHIHLI